MRHISLKSILTACFVLLIAVTASAFGEIRYPDRALNLRDGRSPDANWVGSLAMGQEVRVAHLEGGWVAVFEPGETRDSLDAAVGFANLKYLKSTRLQSEESAWGRVMEVGSESTLRDSASGLGENIGVLEAGRKIRVDFPDDGWIMAFPAGATIRSKMGALGFVKKDDLRPVSASVAAKADVPSAPSIVVRARNDDRDVYTDWGKLLVLKSPVKIYRERTADSRLETTLGPGKKVRVDFLENGWYAVFEESERLRKEYRALGYARKESLEEGREEAVSLNQTLAAATGSVQDAESPTRRTVELDKSRIVGGPQPDPKPDKTLHGYQYKLLKKDQIKRQGETWITLTVFLATTKLPNQEALEDFASSLWKEYRRVSKNLAVLIYLPGMDTKDISYGVIQFDDEKMIESWVRRTTLFGTKFL